MTQTVAVTSYFVQEIERKHHKSHKNPRRRGKDKEKEKKKGREEDSNRIHGSINFCDSDSCGSSKDPSS